MEEISEERGKSMAAPAIFVLVFSFHFVSKCIESHKKKLRIDRVFEISPNCVHNKRYNSLMYHADQEMREKDMKMSFNTYEKLLLISKVVTYVLLVLWFWKMPVTTISDQLVQPFGKLISWRAGRSLQDDLAVGIIPWLIVSTRVSKFICR
ncbi:eukaryotic translation initiation factor 3subunit 7, partial [Striga asiatica]